MKSVIAIFDIGKTNKKFFLFDEDYKIVFERSARLPETVDENGFPCENLSGLKSWLLDSLKEIAQLKTFAIKALNFTTYGASFVYLNEQLQPFTPLYNYLKPFPESLQNQFYDKYGGEEEFSFRTASPVLGSLNSGMQFYRIKYEKPEVFHKIKYALHLPQYLSFLITGKAYSDMTSIGCHTNLWDFIKNDYHDWVKQEGILEKLPSVLSYNQAIPSFFGGKNYLTGIGLHDNSAALIPYLTSFKKSFILLSTGTWCVSLNPFNNSPLTKEELQNDCLNYITYEGKPVKASRLFAGYEHEQQLKRISQYFNKEPDRYYSMNFQPEIISRLQQRNKASDLPTQENKMGDNFAFASRQLADFNSDEEAYHQLLLDIVSQQYRSTQWVLNGTDVKRIFVDGGFSKSDIYMNLLALVFPELEIFAASMAQATALGAALAIHEAWNPQPVPHDLIELKYFSTIDNQ